MAEDEEPKEEQNLSGEDSENDESEQSFDDELVSPSASLLIHNYLQSENGHEIAKQIVDLIKGIKQLTLGRNVDRIR